MLPDTEPSRFSLHPLIVGTPRGAVAAFFCGAGLGAGLGATFLGAGFGADLGAALGAPPPPKLRLNEGLGAAALGAALGAAWGAAFGALPPKFRLKDGLGAGPLGAAFGAAAGAAPPKFKLKDGLGAAAFLATGLGLGAGLGVGAFLATGLGAGFGLGAACAGLSSSPPKAPNNEKVALGLAPPSVPTGLRSCLMGVGLEATEPVADGVSSLKK